MTSQTIVSTEIERQREYLSRLPQGFQFSLFNYKVALESQRKSAYKTTVAAAREIVDNSIEAGCSQIDIVFRQGKSQSGHTLVDAIAFIDNGPGMLPEMTRYALCWGGGTHYDAPNHIGRFGFGLPNSSINQTRLVEVYSRTAEDEPIYKCRLNIDEFVEFWIESIPEPAEADLPEFSRVPGSGVIRGRGSGERETTASSLAGKEESSRKEDNSGQGKDGPAGVVAQGGNGR